MRKGVRRHRPRRRRARAPSSQPALQSVWDDPAASLDFDLPLDIATALAEGGDRDAQYQLGMTHLYGDEANPDFAQAYRWLSEAANQDHSDAAYELGRICMSGCNPNIDARQAASWLRKADDLGHTKAQMILGCLYSEGHGVEKDAGKSAACFIKAAENGNAEAMYVVACLYDDGAGVPEDLREAARWCRKSAELGYVHSQYMMALRLARGYGVEIDQDEAQRWADKALDQANATATEMLRRAKRSGDAPSGDLFKAYIYCSHLAVARGDPTATRNVEEIGKHMAASEIEMAKAATEDFMKSFPSSGKSR